MAAVLQCYLGDDSVVVWSSNDNDDDNHHRMIGGNGNIVASLIHQSDGRYVMQWRTIPRMYRKEELVHVMMKEGHDTITLNAWQPFFKFVNTNGSRLVRCILVDHGYIETNPDSNLFDVLWTGKHIKKTLLQAFGPHQRINHFPRTYEITRKVSGLWFPFLSHSLLHIGPFVQKCSCHVQVAQRCKL